MTKEDFDSIADFFEKEERQPAVYLSDVFDIDEAINEYGNKIVIVSGVGSGKSTWVKEVLAKKGSVLFVTSRKVKVEADVNASSFTEAYKWYTESNQTLITNARLAQIIRNIETNNQHDIEEFIDLFDYIVIDEVHSIAADSAFADSCPYVLSFMEYALEKGKPVIAMTGTPEPMQWYFKNKKWKILNYTRKCRYVHPKEIHLAHQYDVENIIKSNLGKKKIIYFSNRTDTIGDICKGFFEKSIIQANRVAAIVSKSKENDFNKKMKEKLGNRAEDIGKNTKMTYSSIIKTNLIPDECDLVFSTSALKEGIDILNDDVIMICENHIMTNLIQFFGRVRGKRSIVYILQDTMDHHVDSNLLIAEYAARNEVKAANSFLNDRIKSETDVLNYELMKKKIEFIKYIQESNPYIYFDYIYDEFRVFVVKICEELRLQDNASWKKELSWHCVLYNIKKSEEIDRRKLCRKILFDMVSDGECSKKMFGEAKAVLMRLIYTAYEIKSKQWKSINKELEEKNAPFRIHSDKETKTVNRDKTYWVLTPIENIKNRRCEIDDFSEMDENFSLLAD